MLLVLEDGFMLSGERGGSATDAGGEVVFNTCMSGYQEVLSDPSYAGQLVVMTYPLIGNYGVSQAFLESGRPWVRALITRSLSPDDQHWRRDGSVREWLDSYGVPILTGVDTRRLVSHLRGTGAQRGVIVAVTEAAELESLVARVRSVLSLKEQNLVKDVRGAFVDGDRLNAPAIGHNVRVDRDGV